MSEDKITLEELRYLSIFQDLTDALPYRCIIDDESNRLIFLVKPEDVGKAIGRRGSKIRILNEIFKRNIEVVAYSDDLETMVKNLFPGVNILDINIVDRGGERTVILRVDEKDKGRAIGREGRNIKRARLVLKKLFNVQNVIIK